MSQPSCVRPEIEQIFGMQKSHISSVLDTFMYFLYDIAIPYFSSPDIHRANIPAYATAICDKCGIVKNVCGYADGMICERCQLVRHQHLLYSGYKS